MAKNVGMGETRKALFDPNFMLFIWIEYSQNDGVLKSELNPQSSIEKNVCVGSDPLGPIY